MWLKNLTEPSFAALINRLIVLPMQFLILSVTPETKTHISLRLNWTNFLLSTRPLPTPRTAVRCQLAAVLHNAVVCSIQNNGYNGLWVRISHFNLAVRTKVIGRHKKTSCPVVRVVSILCTVRGARLSDAHIHQFRQARQRAPAGLTHVTLTISCRTPLCVGYLQLASYLVSPS